MRRLKDYLRSSRTKVNTDINLPDLDPDDRGNRVGGSLEPRV